MFRMFRSRIQHPLYPAISATPAEDSCGQSPALAGTFEQLLRAGTRHAQASRAVYVLLGDGDPPLSDAHRDALWELFQVPVYVLVVDANRRICAYECEAHEGLHLPAITASRRPRHGVEMSPCNCGRPGPRLTDRSLP